MYLTKTIFILLFIKIFTSNAEIVNNNYNCSIKGYNITDYSNKDIINESVLNNLTYVINNFKENKNSYNGKKGFSFTTPISYNNYTFGYCSINIKKIDINFDLLFNIINKLKNNCVNNEYSQGYFDNGKNIRICYDLINANYDELKKRKCYRFPKWY